MTDTAVDIAYIYAKENLSVQRARLDNVRARSAAVVTAAAVVASFLGGQAMADTRIERGATSPVADRSLQLYEAVGCGAFLLVLLISAWIIKPKKESWIFRLNPEKILDAADAGRTKAQLDACQKQSKWIALKGKAPDLDEAALVQSQKRALVGHLESYYQGNEAKLGRLFALLQLSVVLLALESAGFMLDLTS